MKHEEKGRSVMEKELVLESHLQEKENNVDKLNNALNETKQL